MIVSSLGAYRIPAAGSHRKPVPFRGAVRSPGPGGGPHQCEMGQVQTDGPGCGILSQHDVNGKTLLHGRVQHLLPPDGSDGVFLSTKAHPPLLEDY